MRTLLVGCISLAAVSSVVASCAASESQSPEWLFVQASSHARVSAASTLEIPVQSLIFGFTDRPDRQYAYLSPGEFASLWDANLDGGFSTDPPNAVLTWRVGDQVGEAELAITDAHYSETDAVIVYEITIETGELAPGDLEVVSLFVDDFAMFSMNDFDPPPSCWGVQAYGPNCPPPPTFVIPGDAPQV